MTCLWGSADSSCATFDFYRLDGDDLVYMGTERFIENNVNRNCGQLGYMDSVNIPRCCAGLGFGIVDVTLLPLRRPKRLC